MGLLSGKGEGDKSKDVTLVSEAYVEVLMHRDDKLYQVFTQILMIGMTEWHVCDSCFGC